MWLNSPPDERVSARSPSAGLIHFMRLVLQSRILYQERAQADSHVDCAKVMSWRGFAHERR